MACNGGRCENDEEGVEAARSTDKCPRTANNGGAGSGVRDVLTFLYTDVSLARRRVGDSVVVFAPGAVLLLRALGDECAKW